MKRIFILPLLIMLLPINAIAAGVLVNWNANTEDDLAGYKVYYRTAASQYGSPVDVGNVTSHEIADLGTGSTYYVAVTAYDTSGNESGYSEEASAFIPTPDTTAPAGSVVINGGAATTSSRTVSLALSATDNVGVAAMQVSNDGSSWSAEGAYASSQTWVVPSGDGTKPVYARFRDAAGNWSSAASDTIELVLDSDGDGLPDAWEIAYGLDPTNPADAASDSDNDGISNLEEFHASMNPADDSDNAPVVNAGADQVVNPTRVTLDGSGTSDPNGDALEYAWAQNGGPAATLDNSHAVRPSFLGVQAGVYAFTLNCSDGKASRSDTVRVTVNNVAPSVDAGADLTVEVGQPFTLHASGTDPNNDSLAYSWSLKQGPEQVNTMQGQDVSLSLVEPGLYTFAASVSDGTNSAVSDEVVVTVNDINRAPTANAGLDQEMERGARVALDGSASSDPDGDELNYVWSQTAGPVEVALSGVDTSAPGFDALTVGTYTFALTVNDGEMDSTPDLVTVRVLESNRAPVAVAGSDVVVSVGTEVVLDGRASNDPDGDSLTCRWIQTAGATVNLSDENAAVCRFTPTTSGVLGFTLQVSDGQAADGDTVQVTVNSVNQVPVAHAGADFTAQVGELVVLDGSVSEDADGDELSYFWSQTSGGSVALNDPHVSNPSFVPEQAGTYEFALRVFDGMDTSTSDTVRVTVSEEEVFISLLSPADGSRARSNPRFTWQGEDVGRYRLYVALNGGRYYELYSGSSTSYRMHSILWYWFIPYGTRISWYVEGETAAGTTRSEVQTFTKG